MNSGEIGKKWDRRIYRGRGGSKNYRNLTKIAHGSYLP